MKDKGDNPVVGRETTDIYDGENHGYKEIYSLEKDNLEAFATIWTLYAYLCPNSLKAGTPDAGYDCL